MKEFLNYKLQTGTHAGKTLRQRFYDLFDLDNDNR